MGNYLGVDVGSITTKLVVLSEGDQLLAKSYIRNSGRPIEAIQQGMAKAGLFWTFSGKSFLPLRLKIP